MQYLEEWEKCVHKKKELSSKERSKMLLSAETRLGIKVTGKHLDIIWNCSFPVRSFVELTKYLFTLPGVNTFLSEKLSQDPLEQFFGCQRQRGGTSENPNVAEFCKNTQALRVINTACGERFQQGQFAS